MKIDDVISAKIYALEFLKDSPLFLYVAFYEPLHTWIASVAETWNPVLQFILNVLALVFGIARLIPFLKAWFSNTSVPDDPK